MGFLDTIRKPGQKIVLEWKDGASPKLIMRCLLAEGIRIRVLSVGRNFTRIAIRTPEGIVASRVELLAVPHSSDREHCCLALSRRAGDEITILRRGSYAPDEAVLALRNHRIELEIAEIKSNQVRIRIRAAQELYIVRSELITKGRQQPPNPFISNSIRSSRKGNSVVPAS